MTADPIALLTALGLGSHSASIVALIALIGYGVTWVAPLMAPPAANVGPYATLYGVVQKIAANVGHARNATAPESPPASSIANTVRAIICVLVVSMTLVSCGLVTTNTTTTNGVSTTTVTVNVAELNTYATAINNGAQALKNIPGLSGNTLTSITAVTAKIASDVSTINTNTSGSQTLTFTAGNTPADIQQLLTDTGELLSDASGAVPADDQVYVEAIQTVVGLINDALGTASAPLHPAMTKDEALRRLGVQPAH